MRNWKKAAAASACSVALIASFGFHAATAMADATDDTPTITLSTVPVEGGTVTISGTGFAPTGNGIYVAIAPDSVTEFYGNSDKFYGAGGDSTTNGSTWWISRPDDPACASFDFCVPMSEDGTFTVEMNAPAQSEGAFNVLTTKAHGTGKTDKSQDTRTPLVWGDADATTETPSADESTAPSTEASETPNADETETPAPTESSAPAPSETTSAPAPEAPATTDKETPKIDENKLAVSGGSLTWGLRTSFMSYIQGSIANGSATASDGASFQNSKFTFPASSGVYNLSTREGTLNFSGTMHFEGHHGILNTTFSNPSLVISGNSAVLYLTATSNDMEGKVAISERVAFANVALNIDASKTNLTINTTSVNLTAAGAKAFAGFYAEGEPLDNFTAQLTMKFAQSIDANGNVVEIGADGNTYAAGSKLPSTGVGSPLAALSLIGALGVGAAYVLRRRAAAH